MQNMSQGNNWKRSCGRMRCAILLSPRSDVRNNDQSAISERKSGFIQISPSREGPWTTVRLNYAASAACWRLGNDVVASEVSVKDGNRYVNIRSLVSVCNKTDFILDLCLVPQVSGEDIKPLIDASTPEGLPIDCNRLHTDEYFETEKYSPTIGWVGFKDQNNSESGGSHQVSYKISSFLHAIHNCHFRCISHSSLLCYYQLFLIIEM